MDQDNRTVVTGGWSLIIAALLFMAVFGYLAGAFNYPGVLDGSAGEVFPRLLALGATGRAVWAVYGMIPLLLVPAGLGIHAALTPRAPSLGRYALIFALAAAGAMMAGLLRWPSIQWALAERYVVSTTPAEQGAIAAVFAGLNSYLGNFIGEFLGELTLNLSFLFTALGLRRVPSCPKWIATAGLVAAVLGLVALWRNVTPLVAQAAAVENYVLPAWMILLGVALVRWRPTDRGIVA